MADINEKVADNKVIREFRIPQREALLFYLNSTNGKRTISIRKP